MFDIRGWFKNKVRRKRSYEYEFLPSVLQVIETPPSRASRAILWVIISFIVIALLWSIFGKMDVVAVATGRIEPVGHVKLIQALETSRVKKVHVVDGQMVSAGDVLLELDPTDPESDRRQVELEFKSSQIKRFRISTLLKQLAVEDYSDKSTFVMERCKELSDDLLLCIDQVGSYEKDLSLFNSQRVKYEEEIEKNKSSVKAAEATLESLRQVFLVSDATYSNAKKYFNAGALTHADLIEVKEKWLGDRAKIYSAKESVNEGLNSLSIAFKQYDEFTSLYISDKNKEYEESDSNSRNLEISRIKMLEREDSRYLRAPVNGVVTQLKVHTENGVVTPADVLMTVVPVGTELQASVLVENKDAGFIVDGMEVRIKVDSFNYTKYGFIPGIVVYVAPDAVLDENIGYVFPCKIKLSDQNILIGKKYVSLFAGMTVTADIKIGERPVIDYFLTNFVKYQDESFREI